MADKKRYQRPKVQRCERLARVTEEITPVSGPIN